MYSGSSNKRSSIPTMVLFIGVVVSSFLLCLSSASVENLPSAEIESHNDADLVKRHRRRIQSGNGVIYGVTHSDKDQILSAFQNGRHLNDVDDDDEDDEFEDDEFEDDDEEDDKFEDDDEEDDQFEDDDDEDDELEDDDEEDDASEDDDEEDDELEDNNADVGIADHDDDIFQKTLLAPVSDNQGNEDYGDYLDEVGDDDDEDDEFEDEDDEVDDDDEEDDEFEDEDDEFEDEDDDDDEDDGSEDELDGKSSLEYMSTKDDEFDGEDDELDDEFDDEFDREDNEDDETPSIASLRDNSDAGKEQGGQQNVAPFIASLSVLVVVNVILAGCLYHKYSKMKKLEERQNVGDERKKLNGYMDDTGVPECI